MTPADRLRAQLERRVRAATPTLAAEVLRAWDRLAAQLSTAQLARILAMGDVEQVFAQLLTPELLDRVFGEVQRALFAETTEAMAFFGSQYGKGVGVAFGVLSPEVIEGIRSINVKMADSLKDDVRDLVRAYVENGIRDGVNPRTTARAIRQGVGLTDKQLAWVDNFRAELEANQRSALNRALGRGVFTKPDGSLGFKPGHAGGIGVSKRDMELLRRTLGTHGRVYFRASLPGAPAQFNAAGGLYVFDDAMDAIRFAQANPGRILEAIPVKKGLRVKAIGDMEIEVAGFDKNLLARYRAQGYDVLISSGTDVGRRGQQAIIINRDALANKLTTAQIDRLVDQYQKRLTAWHAETLARTAALDAQKTGQHLATKQAIADGILDAERMVSEWLTVRDSRVRDEHAAMQGETTRFGEPFSNGETIPGESTYNCRCIKRDYQERAKP